MGYLRVQFGKRLRQLRRERKMTQEQLAAAIDVSVEFVSYIERGIHAPSFETIEKLAEAFGVAPAEFFVASE